MANEVIEELLRERDALIAEELEEIAEGPTDDPLVLIDRAEAAKDRKEAMDDLAEEILIEMGFGSDE